MSKILYLPVMDHNLPAHCASDYQSDMLFHGLRSLYGVDVIESPYMWWMYEDELQGRALEVKQIWGKGFTIYGLLKSFSHDEESMNHEGFEYCIIPIHHTNILNTQRTYEHIVNALKIFPGNKIAVVDGWDRDYIHPAILDLCQMNKVKYFKRELYTDVDGVYPITFAFPKEKIKHKVKNFYERQYDIAPLIPVNQSIDAKFMSTYVYEYEREYYAMYENSVFALTSKKGGWDTLRHYEIIANGCIPIFVDIETCPQNCLWNFPKDLCYHVNRLDGLFLNTSNESWLTQKIMPHCGFVEIDKPGYIDSSQFDYTSYFLLFKAFNTWLLSQGTTEALAKYVMDKLNED